MSQDQLIPVTPAREENAEEIQIQKSKAKKTPKNTLRPSTSRTSRRKWGKHLGQLEEVQTETRKLLNCDRNKLEG